MNNNLQSEMKQILPSKLTNQDVMFVCIGTDRSTGDSFGPLIGTFLTRLGYTNVMGTLEDPLHAVNLKERLKDIPEKTIIAIDSSLGQITSVGKLKIRKGHIKPGAGLGKVLPEVGDYSITGIVNVGGFMEYFVLQNTRLGLVMDMAEKVVSAIVKAFPLQVRQEVAATKEPISSCCKASIVQGTHKEYPLGGSKWYQAYTVDICSECGKEAEEVVFTCECCGEPADRFVETRLGDWCQMCVEFNADELMERTASV